MGGGEERLPGVEIDRDEVQPIARLGVENRLDGLFARVADRAGRQALVGIGVVGVGGIGDLIGRWDSTRTPHSVQNSGIHLKITAGRPIGVPQTVVDDPGDFPVVLRGGLALHNRGLGQHGLIVRLRHAQILQAFDGGGDH